MKVLTSYLWDICALPGCSLPLGLQRKSIPDGSFSASSSHSSFLRTWKPSLARLHQEGGANAWRPMVNMHTHNYTLCKICRKLYTDLFLINIKNKNKWRLSGKLLWHSFSISELHMSRKGYRLCYS